MDKKRQTAIIGILASVLVGALVAWAGSDGSVTAGSLSVFAIAAAASYLINWAVYVPSYLNRTEHYFDLTGSLTYISVTVLALALSDGLDTRAWIAGAMVLVWAARLGSFLFRRVRQAGKDGRFDQLKTDPLRFLMTWSLQGLWVLLTAACAWAIITASSREDLGLWAIVGIVVWVFGFTVEVTADRQKSAFKADPDNAGKFITTGLWGWARHPNYFGEIVLWTGMAIMAVPVLSGWRWVLLISPVFVFLLLTRISGIPLLTARGEERWGSDPAFREYVDNTPALLLRPPRSGG